MLISPCVIGCNLLLYMLEGQGCFLSKSNLIYPYEAINLYDFPIASLCKKIKYNNLSNNNNNQVKWIKLQTLPSYSFISKLTFPDKDLFHERMPAKSPMIVAAIKLKPPEHIRSNKIQLESLETQESNDILGSSNPFKNLEKIVEQLKNSPPPQPPDIPPFPSQ